MLEQDGRYHVRTRVVTTGTEDEAIQETNTAVATTPRSKVGQRLGRLAGRDIGSPGRAVVAFFGLAGN